MRMLALLLIAGCGGEVFTSLESDASSDADANSDADAHDTATCSVPVQHTNGKGQTFTTCAPLGTHDEPSALAACQAYAAIDRTAGPCAAHVCFPSTVSTLIQTSYFVVWVYAPVPGVPAAQVGYVYDVAATCTAGDVPGPQGMWR